MSDEPAEKQRASHPIRLAFLMLVGARLGFMFPPAIGDSRDPWIRAAPFIHAIVGSLIGLSAELYARLKDKRVSPAFVLAVVACAVLAIAWSRIH
jgi:hypothetical protein